LLALKEELNYNLAAMKKDIHPKYNEIVAKCGCGAEYLVGSTKDGITTEICSACHPFYTGKQKLIDTAGRVEKFRAKQALAKPKKTTKKEAETEEETETNSTEEA